MVKLGGVAPEGVGGRIEDPVRRRRPWLRRAVRAGAAVVGVLVLAVVGASVWTRVESSGHLHPSADAPSEQVAIVFGAQLAAGGTRPMPFLAGRLDTASRLFAAGRARLIVVSGDARGRSGDETKAMAAYLVGLGVPAQRIIADRYGVDTYDTCARAARVYGIRRALLVTQSYHLPRSVTLCRRFGIDAEGVRAQCDGCRRRTLAMNAAREVFADVKAVQDAISRRPPQVNSPREPTVGNALQS